MSTRVIDVLRHTHTIVHKYDVFTQNHFEWSPPREWHLRSECAECGWSMVTVRVAAEGQPNPFGDRDTDQHIHLHHLGVGMFAIPRKGGKVGNDLFIVEEDGTRYSLRFVNGEMVRTKV